MHPMGSCPVFTHSCVAAMLEKGTIFMHSAEKEKRPLWGRRESEEKVWNPGGEIRERGKRVRVFRPKAIKKGE